MMKVGPAETWPTGLSAMAQNMVDNLSKALQKTRISACEGQAVVKKK